MLNFEIFKEEVSKLSTVESISKEATYQIHEVDNNSVIFSRNNQSEVEVLPLKKLYNFYVSETEYKTTIAKKYIPGRQQSPAVAILLELQRRGVSNKNTFLKEFRQWWLDSSFEEKIRNLGCGTLSIVFVIGFIVAIFQTDFSEVQDKYHQFDTCIITHDIYAAIDEESYDELTRYAVHGDKLGVMQLMYDGKAYGVGEGEKCMYVRKKRPDCHEVFLYGKNVNVLVPGNVLKLFNESKDEK